MSRHEVPSPSVMTVVAAARFAKPVPTMTDWDGYMTNPGYDLNSDLKMHVGFRHGHTQFGSVWGNYYQGAGNVAECMIFGRICARSIIAQA